MIYEDIGRLPPSLGRFDVAVIAAVLLHSSNPLRIIAECAARAEQLVITDLYFPDLDGNSALRFHPTPENKELGRWWDLSADLVLQFLRVMGFSSIKKTVDGSYLRRGKAYELFTVVASGRGE
jgi:O-methyltransferase